MGIDGDDAELVEGAVIFLLHHVTLAGKKFLHKSAIDNGAPRPLLIGPAQN